MPPGSSERTAAIVLAGGTARRLGGVDKAALHVGGATLLDGVLDAVRELGEIAVVGAPRQVSVPVRWTREEPAGGGPVAGLVAGLRVLEHPSSVVLCACDLTGFTAATVRRLLDALDAGHAGAVLRDPGGRDQWLASAWNARSLGRALPDEPAGVSLRATLGPLRYAAVPARAGEAVDIDTPEQLRAARHGD